MPSLFLEIRASPWWFVAIARAGDAGTGATQASCFLLLPRTWLGARLLARNAMTAEWWVGRREGRAERLAGRGKIECGFVFRGVFAVELLSQICGSNDQGSITVSPPHPLMKTFWRLIEGAWARNLVNNLAMPRERAVQNAADYEKLFTLCKIRAWKRASAYVNYQAIVMEVSRRVVSWRVARVPSYKTRRPNRLRLGSSGVLWTNTSERASVM